MKRTLSLLALLLSLLLLISGCALDSSDASVEETLTVEETKETPITQEEKSDTALTEGEKEEGSLPEASSPSGESSSSSLEIPAYSGELFILLNDNIPSFSEKELTTVGYESYSDLDALGRCGAALASCGKEIMPKIGEKRGSISSIYPSGWVQASYDNVSGKYLYNRSHLIGWQLSAENANEKNLITGTRYFNTEGMLPFENMVADYIKETGNHVAYRVTPVYDGENLVAKGVRMEAKSVEDQGEGILFHVFVYNVQPGISIDYRTGKSALSSAPSAPVVTTAVPTTTTAPVTTTQNVQTAAYVLNTNTKKVHKPSCHHVKKIKDTNRLDYQGALNDILSQGYTTCGTCF